MTFDFMSYLTVFQSYQGNRRVIKESCLQWNSVLMFEKILASAGIEYAGFAQTLKSP